MMLSPSPDPRNTTVGAFCSANAQPPVVAGKYHVCLHEPGRHHAGYTAEHATQYAASGARRRAPACPRKRQGGSADAEVVGVTSGASSGVANRAFPAIQIDSPLLEKRALGWPWCGTDGRW